MSVFALLVLAFVASQVLVTGCGGPSSDDAVNSVDSNAPGDTTIHGAPLNTVTPLGPAWIVGPTVPPTAPPTMTTLANGRPTMPPGQTAPTTAPGPSSNNSTTTSVFPRFACTARVNLFLGESTGESRRVKVAVSMPADAAVVVWAETRWDTRVDMRALTVNPSGAMQFVLYAPGNEWPVTRIFAAGDLRPASQMCNS